MTALKYKDFQGSVEFQDGQLLIRILHIDDLISTQIDSAQKAQTAFEELVDDYLQTCEELGRPSCKPFKGSFNVRVSPELHRSVAMAAVETGETLNAWVGNALAAHVERHKAKKEMLSHGYALRVISGQRSRPRYGYESIRSRQIVVSEKKRATASLINRLSSHN